MAEPTRTAFGTIRKVVALPRFELAWAAPAWVLLGLARAAVLAVPFRRLAPLLGVRADNAPWVPLLSPEQERRAETIGRIVRRCATLTPWQSNCFNQAIAACALLRLYRVPYVCFLGARIDAAGAALDAHAWVAAGRVRVTGATSFDRYRTLGCFVSPALAKAMGLAAPSSP